MKTEKLYINGYIGEAGFFDSTDSTFSLSDLNKFLDSVGSIDTLDVFINSGGGSVNEGFAIYDKLSSLPFTVNTIVNGMCGSIATVIFQSAKGKGSRKMFANSEFFVHNPIWIPSSPDAMEAKDLALLHEDLLNAQNRIKDFYAGITGKGIDELTPILDRQTTLTAKEAIDMGFADELITTNIQAFTKYRIAAYITDSINNKTQTMADAKELQQELTGIKGFLAKITKKLFKNAMVTSKDGVAIYYDGDAIVKGTALFSDEAMANPLKDGEYEVDAVEFTVVGGVVTEVATDVPVDSKTAELEAKIAELEASLAAKETLVAETETLLNETKVELVAFTGKVKSFEALLVTGNNFKAEGSQNQGKAPIGNDNESAIAKVARLRAEKTTK